MTRASLPILAAVLGTFLTITAPASANGRFPESNQVLFVEHDPNTVIIRATFGLLISRDRGQTWEWVCEQAIGYSGIEDPMYAVTPSNAIIASTFEGISITRDNGCGWMFAGGDLSDQVFIDLSANPNDKKNVVVFASTYDRQDDAGRIFFTSRVWETKDEGLSFQQLGNPLDTSLLGYTIDLTKSDPNRIYASVVRDPGPAPKALLLTSKDHGGTWAEEPLELVEGERSFYIAAVDPTNAERVYLRTYANSIDKPTRLLLRDVDADGGAPKLRTIYQGIGALPGFALTSDGSKIYVGGPKDGLRVANTSDFDFEQRSTMELTCLGIGPDGLWACSSEAAASDGGTTPAGFSAGLSTDDGVTFEPKLQWCAIKGPLASCSPTSATGKLCNEAWPLMKSQLGCGGDIGVPGDGGFSDAGPGFKPDPPPKSPGGCDCHAAPAGPWGAIATAAVGVLAFVGRMRRNRRRR